MVVGAGSFGTAIAVLLVRGGLRTTLQARTAEQARELADARSNDRYLPGVQLPRELRIEDTSAGLARAEYVFLAVPSRGLHDVITGLIDGGLPPRAAVISLAKGLVPPDGAAPTAMLRAGLGAARVACIGGPAHAQEMVSEGAGLVAASTTERLAGSLAQVFTEAGVVCEVSDDPVGVELAGAAKNAAVLAASAAAATGPNLAGAAAGKVFAEVEAYARRRGARPETFAGLAGTGDLVATLVAAGSRNRRAGEMLASGVPGEQIGPRLGQAAEAVDAVPLLAVLAREADVPAPTLEGLAELLAGRIEAESWSRSLTAPRRPARSVRAA